MDLQRRRCNQLLALGAVCAVRPVAAAAWPSRPIQLVAGAVGGVIDIRARWLAERLAPALGQPIVVVNLGGAGGMLAAEQVARAPADGHTLLFTHQGIKAINPHLYAQVRYDPLADFAPVARFGIGQHALVVPATSASTSVADLLASARARPGRQNYGSPGVGTPPHLAAELLKQLGRVHAVHIPYRGGGALMSALLANEVDWALEGMTPLLPHLKAGKLRALAVSGSRRAAAWPDIPTLAEAGVPGYEYIGWSGVAAPAATPPAIVGRLNQLINEAATSEEGRRFFSQAGAEAGELTPDEFAAFIRSEHARIGRLIQEAGVKVE